MEITRVGEIAGGGRGAARRRRRGAGAVGPCIRLDRGVDGGGLGRVGGVVEGEAGAGRPADAADPVIAVAAGAGGRGLVEIDVAAGADDGGDRVGQAAIRAAAALYADAAGAAGLDDLRLGGGQALGKGGGAGGGAAGAADIIPAGIRAVGIGRIIRDRAAALAAIAVRRCDGVAGHVDGGGGSAERIAAGGADIAQAALKVDIGKAGAAALAAGGGCRGLYRAAT